MAYFPNGTAGDIYQERWCSRCANWRERDGSFGTGCAVWDVHLAYNYDAARDPEGLWGEVLEVLIPTKPDGFAGRCAMFRERDEPKD